MSAQQRLSSLGGETRAGPRRCISSERCAGIELATTARSEVAGHFSVYVCVYFKLNILLLLSVERQQMYVMGSDDAVRGGN